MYFLESVETKERYSQCTNINCGHTFIAHETFVRSIMTPGKVIEVQAHVKGQQPSLSF
ncbi:ogr/Delta-like zinc finger family protein [Hafnia paralvei]|uniref:ogr/Delta-like zinc finger family protein n=1 Tax=Hafnia paralvei TaxID=546367 RepID=UPI001034298B|nr:ogr/Delta-like zinc finger family protein [Hafnia paralvei]TBL60243.1 late control protein B [Hafnia paralvei]